MGTVPYRIDWWPTNDYKEINCLPAEFRVRCKQSVLGMTPEQKAAVRRQLRAEIIGGLDRLFEECGLV